MDQLLTIEVFRALERCDQVRVLDDADAEFIGRTDTKHYTASYYCYNAFFVGLCTTGCGQDFSLVFLDGNEHHEMLWSIGMNRLPKQVRPMLKKERQAAKMEDLMEEYARRPKQTMDELLAELASRGLEEKYDMAKLAGYHMSVFRSFTIQEQSFLRGNAPTLARGDYEHYHARYLRIDDFYHAICVTTDGIDFSLTFRSGRALARMRRAMAEQRS